MPAKQWTNNDSEYEAWVAAHPTGFVANMSKRPNSKYFVVHRAKHNLPDRSNPNTRNPRTGNRYSKVTADTVNELVDWARQNVPALNQLTSRNFCETCTPAKALLVETTPVADHAEYLVRASTIRACGRIERPAGVRTPKGSQGTTNVFFRDPRVRAWVLQRANGECEFCRKPAPFTADHNEAYLESHHIVMLAEGGSDTPENTAAVCPNCHRNLHCGIRRAHLRQQLKSIVAKKEATPQSS